MHSHGKVCDGILEQTSFGSADTYCLADYTAFANSLRAIDEREDVVATVWQGK